MTLFDYIEQYRGENPDATAITASDIKLTYDELYHLLLENHLDLSHKYKSGDKVLLIFESQFAFVISLLSLLSIGCWVIPIYPDMKEDEIQGIADHTQGHIYQGKSIWTPNHKIQSINTVTCIDPNACGIYHLTSGSTGEPKLCIRTLDSMLHEGISYVKTFTLTNSDKILSPPPVYHSYALGAACIAALVAGASLHLVEKFIPRSVLRRIEEERITMILLVPVMVRALINTYSSIRYSLKSIRIALVGAGAIDEKEYNQFYEKYGVFLLSNYGSTETGGLISRIEPKPYNSIGKPMEGIAIRVVDELNKEVLPVHEGTLLVKWKGIMQGYFEADDRITDLEGYYNTGDIVVQDTQGNLYIRGRMKRYLKIGGNKVNLYEVEKVIMQMEKVKECVALGGKKSNGEEIIKTIIVGSDISEYEIRKFCRMHMSEYKIPAVIEFRKSIPRNELGKIKYSEISSSI